MVPPDETPLPDYQANIPVREAKLPEPPQDPGRCPKCQQRIPPGAEFYSACGSRLVPAKPHDQPIADAPWVPDKCPRCGRPMEPGLVMITDMGGHTSPNSRSLPPLEFLPATPDAHPVPEASGVIVHSIPSRREIRSHPDRVLKWYHCKACRILRYPVPAPS